MAAYDDVLDYLGGLYNKIRIKPKEYYTFAGNEDEVAQQQLAPRDEWDDDYRDIGKAGYTEHSTNGYDYIATPYTINDIVQDARNSGNNGGVPYTDYVPGNTNCTTLFGKSLQGRAGGVFNGVRSVPDLVDRAKSVGLFVDNRNNDSGYVPYAGDLPLYGSSDDPWQHATMHTENGGVYQDGYTGGGGYETDNRNLFGFPYPMGYVTTSRLSGEKLPSDYLRLRDDFMRSIYGSPEGQRSIYLYDLSKIDPSRQDISSDIRKKAQEAKEKMDAYFKNNKK